MKKTKNNPAITSTKRLWGWNIVLYTVALLTVSFGSVILHVSLSQQTIRKNLAQADSVECPSSFTIIREQASQLTRPLYLVDVSTESPKYCEMKKMVAATILAYEKKGALISASVYYRNLNDASWMSINDHEPYTPDVHSSIPLMICYLKKETIKKGSLDQELYFSSNDEMVTQRTGYICPGKSYTVRELIRCMILQSDENAAELLRKNLHPGTMNSLFAELEIPAVGANDRFAFSVKDYSKFFRVLFSTTYLNQPLSEYALGLLTQSGLKSILPPTLPKNLIVAGSNGRNAGVSKTEITQSAIVYKQEGPFLLTIMTRGTNETLQETVIREISDTIYRSLERE